MSLQILKESFCWIDRNVSFLFRIWRNLMNRWVFMCFISASMFSFWNFWITSESFWILLAGTLIEETVREVQALAVFFTCLSVSNGLIFSFLLSFSLTILGVTIEEQCPFIFLSTECLEGEFLNKKLVDLRFEVEFTLLKCLLVDLAISVCCLVDSILSLGTFLAIFFTPPPTSNSIEYLIPAECFKWVKNSFSWSELPFSEKAFTAADLKNNSNWSKVTVWHIVEVSGSLAISTSILCNSVELNKSGKIRVELQSLSKSVNFKHPSFS